MHGYDFSVISWYLSTYVRISFFTYASKTPPNESFSGRFHPSQVNRIELTPTGNDTGGSETHILCYFHQQSDWQIGVVLKWVSSDRLQKVAALWHSTELPVELKCSLQGDRIVHDIPNHCRAMTVGRAIRLFPLLVVCSLRSPQSMSMDGIEWEQQPDLSFFWKLAWNQVLWLISE